MILLIHKYCINNIVPIYTTHKTRPTVWQIYIVDYMLNRDGFRLVGFNVSPVLFLVVWDVKRENQ